MSASEILEQVHKLSLKEQREVFERLRAEFEDTDRSLTTEQLAELDRRAENALSNPGRGTPWEELRDEMRLKYTK